MDGKEIEKSERILAAQEHPSIRQRLFHDLQHTESVTTIVHEENNEETDIQKEKADIEKEE